MERAAGVECPTCGMVRAPTLPECPRCRSTATAIAPAADRELQTDAPAPGGAEERAPIGSAASLALLLAIPVLLALTGVLAWLETPYDGPLVPLTGETFSSAVAGVVALVLVVVGVTPLTLALRRVLGPSLSGGAVFLVLALGAAPLTGMLVHGALERANHRGLEAQPPTPVRCGWHGARPQRGADGVLTEVLAAVRCEEADGTRFDATISLDAAIDVGATDLVLPTWYGALYGRFVRVDRGLVPEHGPGWPGG